MAYPEILTALSGNKITTVEEWEKYRRDEILYLFENYVYGVAPVGRPDDLSFSVKEIEREENVLQKKVTISFSGYEIIADLFVPQGNTKKLPCFVQIFHEYEEENAKINESLDHEIVPITEILERGYAVAVMTTSYICPDMFKGDVYTGAIFDVLDRERRDNSWSTIAAWAWGASRVADYLETDKDIDSSKLIALGHSRSGKTSLWASACDTRFAMCCSNNSGCTGAAFLRGKTGEHLQFINDVTNWFCNNYRKYNDNEDMLPLDQHMLLSLIAPRPLCIGSAAADEWADPDAELKSCTLASEVYELYGKKGVVITDEPVKTDVSYQDGTIGYHRRTGEHGLTKIDWHIYMDFADKNIK